MSNLPKRHGASNGGTLVEQSRRKCARRQFSRSRGRHARSLPDSARGSAIIRGLRRTELNSVRLSPDPFRPSHRRGRFAIIPPGTLAPRRFGEKRPEHRGPSTVKILVCVKRVPDPNQRVSVRADGSGIDDDELTFVINPFDEVALEEAISIRERSSEPVEVVAVGIGAPEYDEQLRIALAMGADRALLVLCDRAAGPVERGPDPAASSASRITAVGADGQTSDRRRREPGRPVPGRLAGLAPGHVRFAHRTARRQRRRSIARPTRGSRPCESICRRWSPSTCGSINPAMPPWPRFCEPARSPWSGSRWTRWASPSSLVCGSSLGREPRGTEPAAWPVPWTSWSISFVQPRSFDTEVVDADSGRRRTRWHRRPRGQPVRVDVRASLRSGHGGQHPVAAVGAPTRSSCRRRRGLRPGAGRRQPGLDPSAGRPLRSRHRGRRQAVASRSAGGRQRHVGQRHRDACRGIVGRRDGQRRGGPRVLRRTIADAASRVRGGGAGDDRTVRVPADRHGSGLGIPSRGTSVRRRRRLRS